MATRLKTTEWWFPMLATAVDAADTNFGTITVFIPDTRPANPFKTAFLEVVAHDRNTTLGNISRRQLSMSVGGSAYTVVNNANAITNGGEQQTVLAAADFTALFNTSFTGTSHTVDARVLFDSAVATPLNPAFSNFSARLVLTYEYDDASVTQGKTVWIPLNAPTGALATSKPGSPIDTIPALDTYLPEASKTFRQLAIVTQGNDHGTTADISISHQVDTDTAYTSQLYEHASNVSMFCRQNSIQTFTTNETHGFFLWGSAAVWHHQQAWLVVNYEFDASASNAMMVSLLLPMEMNSPMGGPAAGDYQRATRDLWVQEPGPIAIQRAAAMVFWDQLAAIGGLNMRIGTGSFVSYADAAATVGGSNSAMIRNDAAFSLDRGKNTGNLDIYRTDTADIGYNVCCLWMVNYTCAKPTAGYGAANHTVLYRIKDHGTTAATAQSLSSASVPIPEADYFLNAIGIEYKYVPSGAIAVSGCAISAERLAAGEGGVVWESVYADIGGTDGETGIYHAYATARSVFRRWPGDTVDGNDRLDIEVSRRIRTATANSVATFDSLLYLLTYHTITYEVGGSVSGSDGGTVTLHLTRASDGQRLKQATRSGDGAYSFSWYDNTAPVFVEAREADGFVGRSDQGVATGSP